MEDLRLVGLSADGSRLVLQNAAGQSVALPLDERVHAALRGDRSRLGQLQIAVDGQMRPREIQARIRAGQSSQQVAESAGLPVDKVARFEAPILLERTHMAERAQAVGVRRVTDSVTTPLGVLVQSRLDEHGVDTEALEWDSWRREDGRWQVTLAYSAAGKDRKASWTFDPMKRTLEPADDEARWITDEERAAPPPTRARGPRLSAVPAPQPDLEEPTHDTVPVLPTPLDATATASAARRTELGAAPDPEPEPAPQLPPSRTRSGSRRASVPSWDEILFGSAPKRDSD